MQTFPYELASGDDGDPVAADLLATAPVVRAQMPDGNQVWLALSHEAVRRVLTDATFSRAEAIRSGAPVLLRAAVDPDLLLSMDPPRHTRIRRVMARAFSPRVIDQLAPRIRQLCEELLDAMVAHGSPADLVTLFAEPLPIMVLCELLGVPYGDRDKIRTWATRVLSTDGLTIEEIVEAIRQIREYLSELATARRAEPGHDLITELVRRTDEQEALSETELLANLQLLLIAGHETTTNQLSNSLLALFRHPDQLALLRDRPELIERSVDELMRYVRLTVPMLATIALHDTEITGVAIKTGEAVVAVNPAANRDPAVFADPDRLDLTRGDSHQQLGFGHGIHFCLGAQTRPARTSHRAHRTAEPISPPVTRDRRNRAALAHRHPHPLPHSPARHLVTLLVGPHRYRVFLARATARGRVRGCGYRPPHSSAGECGWVRRAPLWTSWGTHHGPGRTPATPSVDLPCARLPR